MNKIGKKFLKALAGGALALVAVKALDNRIGTSHYKIHSDKVQGNIRLALLTDLHCRKRENPHTDILNLLQKNSPDLVLLGGDIVEDEAAPDTRIAFLKALSDKYPCFYVSGNHEYLTGSLSRIKKAVEYNGITVLDGKHQTFMANGGSINICGVDDADIGDAPFKAQLGSAAPADKSVFSILLSHKPHFTHLYKDFDFDLVLSGHTHGGQWRLPHIIDGVYAPGQGFFPAYPGGRYDINGQTLIISRGLSSVSSVIPRVFNPLELVFVDICPL